MSLDSDSDSRSMDSRPSDFNDGAEVILTNADFKIEAPRTGEEANQSRSSTPESHKNFCDNYQGHGQGAPVYSCGCYRYKDMARYKCPEPSPSDLEQVHQRCTERSCSNGSNFRHQKLAMVTLMISVR
jgi:hypothetical protein